MLFGDAMFKCVALYILDAHKRNNRIASVWN